MCRRSVWLCWVTSFYLCAEILSSASGPCKQTFNICLFLLTHPSVVLWELVPLVKTSLFFHLVTSGQVTSCCYSKAWQDVVRQIQMLQAGGKSSVSDNPPASLRDKSFEAAVKSLGVHGQLCISDKKRRIAAAGKAGP